MSHLELTLTTRDQFPFFTRSRGFVYSKRSHFEEYLTSKLVQLPLLTIELMEVFLIPEDFLPDTEVSNIIIEVHS